MSSRQGPDGTDHCQKGRLLVQSGILIDPCMYYPVGTGTLPVFSFREYCKDAGKDAWILVMIRSSLQ